MHCNSYFYFLKICDGHIRDSNREERGAKGGAKDSNEHGSSEVGAVKIMSSSHPQS
jgi:hypothetical protein